ncbi:hypothetical protein BRADI_4g09646v3, partial [Brachypodium distachyon]
NPQADLLHGRASLPPHPGRARASCPSSSPSLPARLHLAQAPLRRRPPCARARHPPWRQAPCSSSPSTAPPARASLCSALHRAVARVARVRPSRAPPHRRASLPAAPHRRRLPCSPALPPPLAAQLARPSRAPCWPIFSKPKSSRPVAFFFFFLFCFSKNVSLMRGPRLSAACCLLLLPLVLAVLRLCCCPVCAVALPKSVTTTTTN